MKRRKVHRERFGEGIYTDYFELDVGGEKMMLVRLHGGYRQERQLPPKWELAEYVRVGKTAGRRKGVYTQMKVALRTAESILRCRVAERVAA